MTLPTGPDGEQDIRRWCEWLGLRIAGGNDGLELAAVAMRLVLGAQAVPDSLQAFDIPEAE